MKIEKDNIDKKHKVVIAKAIKLIKVMVMNVL